MYVEKKIEELGIYLPEMSPPKALYIPVRQLGNALFVSGQVPFENGDLRYSGKVGGARTLSEGQDAAQLCIVNLLAAVKAYLGDLDKVKNVVKVQAFVNSTADFTEQHLVVNAASQLLFDVFGDCGRHARTAVAVPVLPMDATVEIEAILEV